LGIRAHEALIQGALRRMIRALSVVAIAGMTRLVLAADPATQSIDIPAEDLGTALLTFAAVTHQQIAFDYKLVEGYKSSALSGTYTVADGLQVLIGTAPFLIRATPSGVLTVAAKPLPVAHDPREATGRPSSFSAEVTASVGKTPRDEVIVSARRAELEPKVRAFVNEISVLEQAEGLARWRVPVCPEVTGLPREDGEFILERFSEIARGAGAPLAAEDCHPNLFIFVTADPTQLLNAMQKRHRKVTFGAARPLDIDEFIATPRVARVWYNSAMETTDDTTLSGFPHAGQVTRPSGISQPGGNQGGGMPPNLSTDWEKTSRVTQTMIWAFTYVYVVVDQRGLEGVMRGQLADYIAMVGLAQIKPGVRLSDAPTILKLFDGTPQSALPRMSDWDQAFLKSLYTVPQNVKVQRGEIALNMVSEIVH
jgi:hypothetical protein